MLSRHLLSRHLLSRHLWSLLTAAVLCLPLAAAAQVTAYTSRSDFSSAAGPAYSFTFDGYTLPGNATSYPNGLTINGVSFTADPSSEGSVFVDDPGDGNGDPFSGHQYLDTDTQAALLVALPGGTTAFGADFSNYGFTTGDTVTAAVNGQDFNFIIPADYTSVFEGFTSAAPITSLSFSGGGFGPALGNVTLPGAAPVPETSSLLSLALLLLLGGVACFCPKKWTPAR